MTKSGLTQQELDSKIKELIRQYRPWTLDSEYPLLSTMMAEYGLFVMTAVYERLTDKADS